VVLTNARRWWCCDSVFSASDKSAKVSSERSSDVDAAGGGVVGKEQALAGAEEAKAAAIKAHAALQAAEKEATAPSDDVAAAAAQPRKPKKTASVYTGFVSRRSVMDNKFNTRTAR
jgi:hypothetical protein